MISLAGGLPFPVAPPLDRLPSAHPVLDFWRTSPNYLLIKVGVL